MKEQIDSLAAALLEERDLLNAALGAMHRTHMRLLDVLAKIEERAPEAELSTSKVFEMQMEKWLLDNIGVLASSLTHVDDFNTHIERVADDRFDYNIDQVEIDISASLRT